MDVTVTFEGLTEEAAQDLLDAHDNFKVGWDADDVSFEVEE